MSKRSGWETVAALFLRFALAIGFLSAVADRFGLWGQPGTPGVAWGAWQPFMAYVATLNWFAPAALLPTLGWSATIAEIVIAVGLMIGWRLRCFAGAAGVLLIIFGIAMVAAVGPKPPLDYSVFVGAAAAFLLAGSHSDGPPTT